MLKKLLSAALLSMVVLATITGCKKSDETTTVTPATNERFVVTIDGVVFKPATSTFTFSNDTVTVFGTDGTSQTNPGKTVTMSFPKAVGTYTVASNAKTNFGYLKDTTTVYIAGQLAPGRALGSGTVTVTAISATNVKGTFSFNAVSLFSPTSTGVTATNGSFNITQ